jgi:hypothetical protein
VEVVEIEIVITKFNNPMGGYSDLLDKLWLHK